jgi:hypothetical protein
LVPSGRFIPDCEHSTQAEWEKVCVCHAASGKSGSADWQREQLLPIGSAHRYCPAQEFAVVLHFQIEGKELSKCRITERSTLVLVLS